MTATVEQLRIGRSRDSAIGCVFACDEAYAPFTAVAIASLYRHAATATDVTVLTPGFSSETLRHFEHIQGQAGHSLRILKIPEEVTGEFLAYHHWPKTSYLRCAIAEFVSHERVLYFDSDLLIRGPLQELSQYDLGDHPVAGVPELTAKDLARAPVLNWLGLPPGDVYINSGVMIMNLSRMRQERFLQAARQAQHSASSSNFRFGDQCVINTVLAGRKASLDLRWNIRTGLIPEIAFHYLFTTGTRGIFHFCGFEKPWMPGAKPVLRDAWGEYLQLTDYTWDEVRRPDRPANPAMERVIAEMREAYFKDRD
ncbi:MAG TPA: glycosyltransferase [Polyangiaceae bacterium]|nr:glycosyltransferase [Polyangiaceae bacterium]